MVNCLYIRPVTEIEIVNIISDFKDSAAGWDELKPCVMRGIKEFIKMPLRQICILSFNTGVFAWELKIANVVPIFKSGDDMLFSNYRPEMLMYNRLIGLIGNNDMLYEYQFGFQKEKIYLYGFSYPFRQNFRGLGKWVLSAFFLIFPRRLTRLITMFY